MMTGKRKATEEPAKQARGQGQEGRAWPGRWAEGSTRQGDPASKIWRLAHGGTWDAVCGELALCLIFRIKVVWQTTFDYFKGASPPHSRVSR